MEVKAYEIRGTATFHSCFFYDKLFFPFFCKTHAVKRWVFELLFHYDKIEHKHWCILVGCSIGGEYFQSSCTHQHSEWELICCSLGWHSAPYQTALNWNRKSYSMEWKPISFFSPRPSFCLLFVSPTPRALISHFGCTKVTRGIKMSSNIKPRAAHKSCFS